MANSEIIGGAWKTKDGRTIPYRELESSHLQNIIRYVEKLSREGFTVRSGGGSTAEDMWYDEDVITGSEVLKKFDYGGLMKEMRRRTGGNLPYST